MKSIHVRQIKNPWVLLVLLPVIFVVFAVLALFLAGSMLFSGKKRMAFSQPKDLFKKPVDKRVSKDMVIEADYQTIAT